MPKRSTKAAPACIDWTTALSEISNRGPHCDLSTVSHVTHVDFALEIAKSGQLSPRLVSDESSLNTKRILVNWFSPNDWTPAGGFRYGNVRFTLGLDVINVYSQLYAIEAMSHTPVAFRYLLTNSLYKFGRADLVMGPLLKSDSPSTYCWYNNICIELMIEEAIKTNDFDRIDFVDHHVHRCSIKDRVCTDKGRRKNDGGALFIAGLVSNGIRPSWKTSAVIDNNELNSSWKDAYNKLLVKPAGVDFIGKIVSTNPTAGSLARAYCNAYYRGHDGDKFNLLKQFKSHEQFIYTMDSEIRGLLRLQGNIELR